MTNCPECDSYLRGDKCKACGWAPKAAPSALPNWEPPDSVRNWTPPTPEEQATIRELIAQTAARIGYQAVPVRANPKFAGPERCRACELGNFSHGGVRYCLAHYRRL